LYKSILLVSIVAAWPGITAAEPDTFQRASSLVEQGNYEGARELYLPEAKAGDVEAQYLLGELYRTGKLGLEGLPGTASNWLKKAAVNDHIPARSRYGQHLAHWKRKKKQKKVRRYLTSAADAGDPNAQFFSALYYLRELYKPLNTAFSSNDKALHYLRMAAENDVLEAQMLLANMLLDGRRFELNPEEGARWMALAAERGVVTAQRRMAKLHAEGVGVAMDATLAHHWYLKAAEQGDRVAVAALVENFQGGIGVEQDGNRAEAWAARLKNLPEPPELMEIPARMLPMDWQRYGPGFVVLDFSVTETGRAADVEVVYADGAGPYNEMSVDAVSRFKYRPAIVNGQPVRVSNIRYCMTWLDGVGKGQYRLASDTRPNANIQFDGGRIKNRSLDLAQVSEALVGLCFTPDPAAATAETALALWAE
jgi:TPR repeat protein